MVDVGKRTPFCDLRDFAEKGNSIAEQLEKAKARVAFKNKGGKYMAYFQAFTNTYGPTEHLRSLYEAAIEPEEIVALSVGTRPDCLPQEMLDLLEEGCQKLFETIVKAEKLQ